MNEPSPPPLPRKNAKGPWRNSGEKSRHRACCFHAAQGAPGPAGDRRRRLRLTRQRPSPRSPPSAAPRVMRALPVTSSSPAVALTSTTGATWKTFTPGAAPARPGARYGRTPGSGKQRNSGERVYLKGQFVVNFADANRAVLRPTSGQSGGLARNLRVIVDYPAGAPLPDPGSTVSRDDARPYEITEVRRQSDGQLNVFVREIIKP